MNIKLHYVYFLIKLQCFGSKRKRLRGYFMVMSGD